MARYPHKAGVYAIELIASDRIYVGSSKNVPGRWYEHRLHLKNGTHHSSKLQRAWSKYGSDAFAWRILEELPLNCIKVDLLAREQFYIDSLKPWFNVLPTAGSRLGATDTEASRKLKSAARRSITDLITHCPQGHEYSPSNTYLTKRNQRICLRCAAQKTGARYVPKTVRRNGPTCKRGHEWTPENTRILKSGTRRCIACAAERQRTKNERTRERYNAGPELREKRRADHARHREERLAQMREHGRKVREAQRAERIVAGTFRETETCRRGHEWTPENTLQWKGKRLCRTCHEASRVESPEQHEQRLSRRRERERAGYHEANQRAYQRRLARQKAVT